MAKANRLLIRTILGDQAETGSEGPFLLARVDGVEFVSKPYEYSLTMLRRHGSSVDVKTLVNTRASMRIKVVFDPHEGEDALHAFVPRHGILRTIALGGHLGPPGDKTDPDDRDDFDFYSASLVPAFAMTAYQTIYRIFERMDVIDVIEEVVQDFPDLHVDLNALKSIRSHDVHVFPKMELCIQFGENTLNFLSRLMNEFGIWYFFDHFQNHDHEVMVLSFIGERRRLEPCDLLPADRGRLGPVRLDDPRLTNKEPALLTVSDFTDHFIPTSNRFVTGNFNPFKPTDPPRDEEQAQRDFDLLPNSDERFREENFPIRFLELREVRDQTEHRLENREAGVNTFSGLTKNPAFYAGRTFQTPRGILVLTFIQFNAYESSYGHTTLSDLGAFLLGAISPITDLFTKHKIVDLGLAAVAGGMNNYLKSIRQNALQNEEAQSNSNIHATTNLEFSHYFDAGALASITTLIPLLAGSLSSAVDVVSKRHADDFSNSFLAISQFAPLPLPQATKPVAPGPHLAVVIGGDGVPDKDKGEIFADRLGRVRVRFPWQRSVPPDPRNPQGGSVTDPLKSDRRTCWVRVSEGWGGYRYGSQFLPRIGEEVVISFVDGDPERPILTGRVYNSAPEVNLPFRDSRADTSGGRPSDLITTTGLGGYRFNGLRTRSRRSRDFEGHLLPDRYHLLRFDDTRHCEQWLMRSQGRLDVTAFAHSFETTYGNRHVKVAEGKAYKFVEGAGAGADVFEGNFGGSAFTTIAGEYDVHVGANRYEQVEKNYEVTVKGDVQFDFKQNLKAVVGATASIGASSIVLEATNQITLKVGSSWIVLGPCGVYVNGPMVYINSGGSPSSASSVTMQNVADAEAAEPGDQQDTRVTDCNPLPSGGGGRRGTHTDRIQPAPPCTLNEQNQICVDPLAGGSSSVAGQARAASSMSSARRVEP